MPLIPEYLRDSFTIKCPKCHGVMKLDDEDITTKKINNLFFDTEKIRYYGCEKCNTSAIVSRRYQYIDENGQEILGEDED